MKILKNSFAFLLTLMMVLSIAIPCFAKSEDGVYEVIYKGGEEGFAFVTNSEYTDSDLFSNFKDIPVHGGLMPGDTRRQIIDIVNHSDYQYIKLYLQAVPHTDENVPVADELMNVNLAKMRYFLNQFTLMVRNTENGETVFHGPAGEGNEHNEAVYLGTLEQADSITLEVLLTTPLEMNNDFDQTIGEIDWRFIAEGFDPNDEDDVDDSYQLTVKKVWQDGNSNSRPDSAKVKLLRKGKTIDTVSLSEKNNWRYTWRDLEYRSGWEVEEVNVPKGYKVSYDSKERSFIITNTAVLAPTGQLNWPIPVLMIAGMILIATGASLLRKGRKNA